MDKACLDGCGDVFGVAGEDLLPMALCFFGAEWYFYMEGGGGRGGATKGSNALFSSYIRLSIFVRSVGDFVTCKKRISFS